MSKKSAKLALWLIGLGISLAMAQPAMAIPQAYKVTPLGSLGGKTFPFSINDSGQITGRARLDNSSPASSVFLWEENTGIQNLGSSQSMLGNLAINNNGQIVGRTSFPGIGGLRAFLWDKDNGVQNLLGAYPYQSQATDINDAGQVVGETVIQNEWHAFLWDQKNGMQDLGGFGGNWSEAYGINNSGQIIGKMAFSNKPYETTAFFQSGQEIKYIIPSRKWSYGLTPVDINDSGEVVGSYEYPDSQRGDSYQAFLWDEENGLTDIIFPNAWYSKAQAINNKGQIVGFAMTDTNGYTVLWENGQAYDLNQYLAPAYSSDWHISTTFDINSKGQITGMAYSKKLHQDIGVLLTPVPEPASLLLLLAGGMGIIPFKKRS